MTKKILFYYERVPSLQARVYRQALSSEPSGGCSLTTSEGISVTLGENAGAEAFPHYA